MSSTDSWLLFLNLAFLVLRAPWNSLSQSFGGEATWMASFGGRIVSAPHVSHTFPRFLEGKSSDTWRDAHAFFCCGICLDELIWYSISYDLLSLLRDGSSRWSNPTRSPERLHLIISDSVQGLGRDGLQLPPSMFQRGASWASWARTLHNFDIFRSRIVQQMFSWVRLHLQFIHLPLFPFHYNLLQSPEPWGSSERLCSENGPIYSKWPSVQNIVATLKHDSKKHLSLQVLAFFGNACFVRCCSWMDIPPRWWTFYAWTLLGRELMGRHCKGCLWHFSNSADGLRGQAFWTKKWCECLRG